MIRLLLLTFTLFSFSVFAQSSCQSLDENINEIHQNINAITIPEMTYQVDHYNCSMVENTLAAVYEIETHLTMLLQHYQQYYFECGREVDVIYLIEDTKINIILMQTLTQLAKDLDSKCRKTL